ncbi:TonB C-terminal domain-containing protein [Oscillatoria laete-virens NRMC-F 0139]|nr:TonB C-terminal domain-containing protein [Oscillatoria laete-virens]MDL5053183.1 TonB C-terminal domain-containing protein [Oscillatoria laete-virens NRMC-F 0139]
MSTSVLKRHWQSDLKLFVLVLAVVAVIHLALLKLGRGGRIDNKEEFPVVPDIAMVAIPRLALEKNEMLGRMPGAVELRDPSFLFRPHEWTHTARSGETASLGLASVVQDKDFWGNGSAQNQLSRSPADFEQGTIALLDDYMEYRPERPIHDERVSEGGESFVSVNPAYSPSEIGADFSLEKSIFKGRNWKNKPVLPEGSPLSAGLTPALVKIAVTPSGRIDFVLMEKSSGSSDTDTAIIRALQRASMQPVDLAINTALVWGEVEVKWAPKPAEPEKKEPVP